MDAALVAASEYVAENYGYPLSSRAEREKERELAAEGHYTYVMMMMMIFFFLCIISLTGAPHVQCAELFPPQTMQTQLPRVH
jgi:hypothetical protein